MSCDLERNTRQGFWILREESAGSVGWSGSYCELAGGRTCTWYDSGYSLSYADCASVNCDDPTLLLLFEYLRGERSPFVLVMFGDSRPPGNVRYVG